MFNCPEKFCAFLRKGTALKMSQNGSLVILNEVKDLKRVDMIRFFASLRITVPRKAWF
jgi:hypothetical protein